MKILKEKFLREDDAQEVESNPIEDIPMGEEPVEEVPAEEEPMDTPEEQPEAPTAKVWKVEFKLGNHTNWSRYEATTKEEAEREVAKYMAHKYPDRPFEIINTDEYIEESLNESLNENIQGQGKYSDIFYDYFNFLVDEGKVDNIQYLASELIRYCKEEDLKDLWYDRMEKVAGTVGYGVNPMSESMTSDAHPIEPGAAVGMASIINGLIVDEYEAIDGYNSAIATAEAEGFSDMINVLTEIQAEENIHIGQLQELMKLVDPNASKIEDGQAEGEEQLANPGTDGQATIDSGILEDINNMTKPEAQAFDRAVREKWKMSPLEFMQEYMANRLPVLAVNGYSDIPNGENAIELDSSDISQGSGNVVIYTYMEPETGKLYRYADY